MSDFFAAVVSARIRLRRCGLCGAAIVSDLRYSGAVSIFRRQHARRLMRHGADDWRAVCSPVSHAVSPARLRRGGSVCEFSGRLSRRCTHGSAAIPQRTVHARTGCRFGGRLQQHRSRLPHRHVRQRRISLAARRYLSILRAHPICCSDSACSAPQKHTRTGKAG